MLLINSSNLMISDIKGWRAPSRKRREANLEALSTDGFQFLPTRRKYKTLVRTFSSCSGGTEDTVISVIILLDATSHVARCPLFQTCSDGLKCVEIHCPLLGLDSSALLVLHSRLWNSTLAEVLFSSSSSFN